MANILQIENQWQLTGELLIDNASTILAKSAPLDMAESLTIDFSGVTDADTSALSLMLAWKRRAAEAECNIQFTNVPTNLVSLAHLYGITEFVLA